MPKRKASNSSVTKKFSSNLNDRNKKSKEESGMDKSKKHILQGPSDRIDNSRDQSEDLPEEDPEEESGEDQDEDPEEESGEDQDEDPEEESGAELEEDPEEESGEEIEVESAEEIEEGPEEESGKELEKDPEEELGEELEEDPKEESDEELEKDPEEGSGEEIEEESAEEIEEGPEEESDKELEEDPKEELGEELEEDPEEESGEELEEDPEEESAEELEEDPEEESAEELEEDPEEESGEKLEDPEEESSEELEEDPEEESGEELEEDPEEESGGELEEDPEEESGEEQEENQEEESEEDPEEELGEEQEEDQEEESGEESGEDPEEDPEIDNKLGNASGNEVPLFSQASIYESQKKYKQEVSQELVSVETTDKSGPEQGGAGSFGKRRRSRWEPQPDGDGIKEDDQTCKRRNTRWSSEEQEKDPGEEQEKDQEEESGEELEEESGGELEEESEEESGEKLDEDPEEELGEEQEEDQEDESGGESGEDPEIDNKLGNASGNEVPLFSQASIYESQKLVSLATTDKSGSEQGGAGSFGKRRHSRWEPQPDGDGIKEDDQTCKRRSTRWSSEETRMKMLGPLQLTNFTENFAIGLDKDPQIQGLTAELLEINRKLQSPVIDDRPEEEKSPSPEPIYNNHGIRLNTREARIRRKLIQIRQNIMSKLLKSDPSFNPPPDHEPQKFVRKLYIPVKEYPEYNFIGLLIGPRGNTQKRMEKETGAKILLRGKGSLKTPSKSDSQEEDLHVHIEANDQPSLDAAVTMVEKLLIPVEEGRNEHKRAQLKELAELKSTPRDENICSVCGERGHKHFACPNLQSTFKMDSFDIGCSNTLSTPTCAVTALFPHSTSLPGSGSSRSLMQNRQMKPAKEISDKNLYVGYLPQSVDDNRLGELFSPFGRITEAKVVKDHSTGLCKGYGFVKFEDSKDAALAIARLNGFRIDGKLLKVRIAGLPPNNETPRLNPIPPIPGRAPLPANVTSQTALPGPLHFMLPEHQSSFDASSSTKLFSSTINSLHDDPMKVKALATPGNTFISSHFGYSGNMHFSGNSSHQSLFSPNNSTAQFPGDPRNLGNFNPFL